MINQENYSGDQFGNTLKVEDVQIKTTMKYYVIPVRMAIIKKSTNNKCWRGCGKKELSYTVGGNVSWHSHYGRHYGGSLKNLKQSYYMIQQCPSWVYTQKK